MQKILIADDHAVVRKGLIQILSGEFEFQHIDEAIHGQDVLDKVCQNNYELVILDISMPGRSGLEILREIKSEYPEISVLILSIHPEEQYAMRTLKAGASGYLTKESVSEELIAAVRKVMGGGRYISSELAEKLAFDLSADTTRKPHETLSDREYQVFRHLAYGKTVKQIADEMALSVKTVSTYRMRILEKMNLKSNSELTRYAIKNKLID